MVTQADFSLQACRSRATALGVVTGALWRRRRASPSSLSSPATLLHIAALASREVDEEKQVLSRSNRISLTEFSLNFNGLGDRDCLFYFRFTKNDVVCMVYAVSWPEEHRSTSRNRYRFQTCAIV